MSGLAWQTRLGGTLKNKSMMAGFDSTPAILTPRRKRDPMTNEDRQILIVVCEQMKEVLDCQFLQDRALRSLGKALLKHLPTLEEDYREAQKDALFASVSTHSIGKMQQAIEGIIERLKRPPAQ
jgi:hypothetical protein